MNYHQLSWSIVDGQEPWSPTEQSFSRIVIPLVNIMSADDLVM